MVPLLPPPAAALLALPLPLLGLLPSSSSSLTRLPPTRNSTRLLPCRRRLSRALAPASSARWPRPQRESSPSWQHGHQPGYSLFSSRENPALHLCRPIEKRQLTILSSSGVAVGSSIGHAIGGMFGGGGSSAPAEAQQQAPAQSQPMDNGLWQSSATNQAWENPACETDVRNFRRCMDENQGNMSICGWYLDQLVCVVLVC